MQMLRKTHTQTHWSLQ